MRLIDRLRRPSSDEKRHEWFSFNGSTYQTFGPITTQQGEKVVLPDGGMSAIARWAYKSNSVVSALMIIRQQVFSTVDFAWQRRSDRELFGNRDLEILERPWAGGTTQNLLARTLLDSDCAGNSYWRRSGRELVWMRPDWVEILLGERADGKVEKAAFLYYEGGRHSGVKPQVYVPEEVAHFMPIQDPEVQWKGMSWLSAAVREIQVDEAASTHQRKFFEQAATPNLAVRFDPSFTPEKFQAWKEKLDETHKGSDNAYKTMYLGGGADVTVVGSDLSGLDLSGVQGRLETRIAALAGVGSVVAQFSEGMQGSSLNAGNYGQARRRFADAVLDPLWREAAGSFARILPSTPAGARLWFDTRHVPFLKDDLKDTAEIQSKQAQAIRSLTEAGYDPKSVVAAIGNDDLGQLTHTGVFSVQLQEPGAQDAGEPETIQQENDDG